MKNIIITILVTTVLCSCFEDRIDLDLNAEDPKLAVEGWITDLDEPQFIILSLTVNYLGDQDPNYVSGAQVTLSDEVESFTMEERNKGHYFLPSDWEPRIGDTYSLEITYEGQTYRATEKMRACPELQDLDYKEDDFDELFEDNEVFPQSYSVSFSFQDPPGIGEGYYVCDYVSGTDERDFFINWGYTNDEFFDGDFVEDVSATFIDYPLFIGDTAIVEMFAVSTEASKYLGEIENELFGNGPFDSPPANVMTNISNGGVGYFMIGAVQRDTIVLK
ncbi:DUF4249 domain-containing protein [Reichenbachiella versicolor]|uniref:DUF4249 domain-containing protein n=1 Tax=Reichenbachiella versicolor TaxID=1821036 RepID=UPI000D6E2432|nr:DUF4249 domain-containing protein [Reichenbachiella versicolor]